MDESALQDRLDRIEQRQYLVVALLVVPYLVAIAKVLGVWIPGMLYALLALVGFAALVVHRRRTPHSTE
ncbi:MAG: hypothetical protein ABEJ74_03260 [Haloferacaceae archaeon]